MDTSRMRIALVSSSYHPHFGGVEEHVRHVARELQARGHAVEVWTVDRGDGLRDEVVDGCRVRYLSTPLPARSLRALVVFAARLPLALSAWAGAYAAFRPDVVHIQCFGPNGIFGLVLATLTRTPLVVSSHGETFADEHSVFDRSVLLRSALRQAVRAGAVTACSSFVADDLRSRFGARGVQVVPNGVQPPTEGDELIPLGTSGPPVVMGVGRLVPQKGFDILLRAAANSHHAPMVLIVGDGAERPGLGVLAGDLGISDRVRFLGRLPPEEVQPLMAQASAVVVPSRAEAFGIVILEAWSAGAPVVATQHGGPGRLVSHGEDGLLTDPHNLPSVVQALDAILGDPVLADRLRRGGRRTVMSYTWKRVVDRYLRLYSQLGDPV